MNTYDVYGIHTYDVYDTYLWLVSVVRVYLVDNHPIRGPTMDTTIPMSPCPSCCVQHKTRAHRTNIATDTVWFCSSDCMDYYFEEMKEREFVG